MKGGQRIGRRERFAGLRHVGTGVTADCERGSKASTMRSSLLAALGFVKEWERPFYEI
jgi:hypothetical protein